MSIAICVSYTLLLEPDSGLVVSRAISRSPSATGTAGFDSASSIDGSAAGGFTARRGFRIPGISNIKGAKKPAWSANSARALPDGNRQQSGSSHSIGIGLNREGDNWLLLKLLLPKPKTSPCRRGFIVEEIVSPCTIGGSVVFIRLWTFRYPDP
jgi:hypothetical protein